MRTPLAVKDCMGPAHTSAHPYHGGRSRQSPETPLARRVNGGAAPPTPLERPAAPSRHRTRLHVDPPLWCAPLPPGRAPTMADKGTPHFHNEPGVRVIHVGSK